MYTSWSLPLELLCMLIDLWLCVLLWQLVQYCLDDFFPLTLSEFPPPSIPSPHSLPFSLPRPLLCLTARFIQALKIKENWGALFPGLKSLGEMAFWAKVLDGLGIFWHWPADLQKRYSEGKKAHWKMGGQTMNCNSGKYHIYFTWNFCVQTGHVMEQ